MNRSPLSLLHLARRVAVARRRIIVTGRLTLRGEVLEGFAEGLGALSVCFDAVRPDANLPRPLLLVRMLVAQNRLSGGHRDPQPQRFEQLVRAVAVPQDAEVLLQGRVVGVAAAADGVDREIVGEQVSEAVDVHVAVDVLFRQVREVVVDLLGLHHLLHFVKPSRSRSLLGEFLLGHDAALLLNGKSRLGVLQGCLCAVLSLVREMQLMRGLQLLRHDLLLCQQRRRRELAALRIATPLSAGLATSNGVLCRWWVGLWQR